jgi:hypothetical protein
VVAQFRVWQSLASSPPARIACELCLRCLSPPVRRVSPLHRGSWPGENQVRAAWAIESRRSMEKDRRLSAGCEAVGGAAYCGDLCPRTCATQMINDGAADANSLLPCEGIGEDFARLTRTGPSCCGALNVHAPQCTRRARAPGWPYLLLLPYSASKSPRHGIREGYSGASPNFRNTSARRLRPARPAMPHGGLPAGVTPCDSRCQP